MVGAMSVEISVEVTMAKLAAAVVETLSSLASGGDSGVRHR